MTIVWAAVWGFVAPEAVLFLLGRSRGFTTHKQDALGGRVWGLLVLVDLDDGVHHHSVSSDHAKTAALTKGTHKQMERDKMMEADTSEGVGDLCVGGVALERPDGSEKRSTASHRGNVGKCGFPRKLRCVWSR